MSGTRYLHFNSAYRDRNEYPYPADFVVEISQSGQKIRSQAKDPISYASPFLYWNNSFREDASARSITNISIVTAFSTTNNSILELLAGTGEFRQINGFYEGAVFRFTPTTGNPSSHRIIKYEFLSATSALVTVDPAFSSTADITGTGVIQNPTPLATNTANAVIKFFIPSGSEYDNAYYNSYVDLVSSPGGLTVESRRITAYNGTTRFATLESATTSDWVANDAVSNSNFVIRQELPCNEGDILAIDTTGRIIQLALTASTNNEQYVSSFIRMVEPVPIAGATPAGFSNDIEPYAEQRRIVKYVAGTGTFVAFGGVGTSTFTLSSNASSEDNFYLNQYITTSAGDTFQVTSYTGSTRAGSIAPNVWTGAAVTWDFRTITIPNGFTINPTTAAGNNGYEIECYTRDSWSPFNYNGTMVSAQQAVCYEIELLNLTLPNILLLSGSRAIYYPYFFVELENVSSASGTVRDAIYSNNPNATRMMFTATMDDNVQPVNSPFIKIDSDGMVQTLKIKPNDSFKFGVYLPNGDLFQTVLTDTVGPAKPNVLVQISACFSLKRV